MIYQTISLGNKNIFLNVIQELKSVITNITPQNIFFKNYTTLIYIHDRQTSTFHQCSKSQKEISQ